MNILLTGGAGYMGSHAAVALERARAFEVISDRAVPCNIVARWPGDVASSCASAEKARKSLRWQARRSLQEMCASTWYGQKNSGKPTT